MFGGGALFLPFGSFGPLFFIASAEVLTRLIKPVFAIMYLLQHALRRTSLAAVRAPLLQLRYAAAGGGKKKKKGLLQWK